MKGQLKSQSPRQEQDLTLWPPKSRYNAAPIGVQDVLGKPGRLSRVQSATGLLGQQITVLMPLLVVNTVKCDVKMMSCLSKDNCKVPA